MQFCGRIAAVCLLALFLGAAPHLRAEGSNPAGTVGYTGANVGEIIERIEQKIDKFAKAFKNTPDDSLDQDRQLLEASEGLEKAFDKVEGKFESGDAVRPRLDQALTVAAEIDKELKTRKAGEEVLSGWKDIRTDLNKLAGLYGVTPLEER